MASRREFLKKGAAISALSVTGAAISLSGCDPTSTEKSASEEPKSLPEKKPNIIFFLTDQHRRQALSLWSKGKFKNVLNGLSDPVHTPHIDKFAEKSVVLSQCVSATPVCSPARAMILTGMYPAANGVPWNCRADREWALNKDADSIADVLSRNEYSCGYIGKWHLDKPERNDPANPGHYVSESDPLWDKPHTRSYDSYTDPSHRQGFDYWYSYGTSPNHHDPHYYDNDGIRHEPKMWATIHEVDMAIKYMNNTDNQRVDGNPYLLFVSTHPPHNNYNQLRDTDPVMFNKYYSPEVVNDVNDLLVRPNVSHEANLPMKMKYASLETRYKNGPGKGTADEVVRYYNSSVSGVDRQFGRLMEALEKSGEVDNTIVVYTADHGEMMGSHGLMAKSTIYEESIGVPMIIRYPEKLKPAINDILMGSMDVMPTLLGLAGLSEDIPKVVGGHDFSEHLAGATDVEKPKYTPYFLHVEQKGLRTDQYSFAINKEGEGVLFDNKQDPYQLNNIYNPDSEIVKEFTKELGKILRKSNDLWYQTRVNKHLIDYT